MFQFSVFRDKASMMDVTDSITEEGGECTASGNGEDDLGQKLSRAALLILDYKQFLAARRIQSVWRSYYARMMFNKRWQAAIVIQRWWRGFRVRLNFLAFVEAKLQRTLIDHYNAAATKIQALFRGWHTRQTVHDMHSLRRMQLCAAEELLSCVARKLHYLLRTYSIPGVYSLRNSHCLSKVEKLLSSMTYRFHNDRVAYHHARSIVLGEERRENFVRNRFSTQVPYSGPNFDSACNPACEDMLFSSKDMDRRMFKIIAEFENSLADPKLNKTLRSMGNRKLRQRVANVLERNDKKQRGFCGDVIDSMRKWKIWENNSLKINHDIFRNPENLSNFLAEVAKLVEQHNIPTCHCQITNFDTVECT